MSPASLEDVSLHGRSNVARRRIVRDRHEPPDYQTPSKLKSRLDEGIPRAGPIS